MVCLECRTCIKETLSSSSASYFILLNTQSTIYNINIIQTFKHSSISSTSSTSSLNMSINTVAIIGANGNIGGPVLKALIESGDFSITVLTRAGSKSTYPSTVKVTVVDFESVDSLTAAFKGQNAVISTIGVSYYAYECPHICLYLPKHVTKPSH